MITKFFLLTLIFFGFSIVSANATTLLFSSFSSAAEISPVKSEAKCLQGNCGKKSIVSAPTNNLGSSVAPVDGRLMIKVTSWTLPGETSGAASPQTLQNGFSNYSFVGLISILTPYINNLPQNGFPFPLPFPLPTVPGTASPIRCN